MSGTHPAFQDAGEKLGIVRAFSVAGLDMWFNSHDHAPPHFHARRAGMWEIRIYFLLCSEHLTDYDVKWGRSPGGRDLRALGAGAVKHRAALLEEWEAKVC
jgi:hypothetical protein